MEVNSERRLHQHSSDTCGLERTIEGRVHVSVLFVHDMGRETYEMKPQIMAEVAIVAMILPLDGAKALNTPIWIPSEPKLAKPQRAYEAMV